MFLPNQTLPEVNDVMTRPFATRTGATREDRLRLGRVHHWQGQALIHQNETRAALIEAGIAASGCEIVARLTGRADLREKVNDIQPDVIIITGGTDGGASRSIQKMLEAIGLACYLMPEEKRPMVLYVGNQKLANEVKELLGGHAGKLQIGPNVRPALETEDLAPASHELASLVMKLRERQLKGVDELNLWSGGNILPTAYAQGRIIRIQAPEGRAEQLRERGQSIVDAAVQSARIRLRPILMTSFAFILGATASPGFMAWTTPWPWRCWTFRTVSAGWS